MAALQEKQICIRLELPDWPKTVNIKSDYWLKS